jgi:hypothetical protein
VTVLVGTMQLPVPQDADRVRDYLNGTIADGGLWTGLTRASNHDHTGGLNGAPISIASIPDGSITTSKLDPSVLLPYALTDGTKPFTGQVTMQADLILRDTLYLGVQGAATPPDVQMARTAPGRFEFASTGTGVAWATWRAPGAPAGVRLGHPVTGATANGAWFTWNAEMNAAGDTWLRDDVAKDSWSFTMNDGGLFWHQAKAAADPIAWVQRLQATKTGQIILNADTGVTGLDVQQGGIMVEHGHGVNFGNPAQSLSFGWATSAANQLHLLVNGSSIGTYFDAGGSQFASGTYTSRPAGESLAGMWLTNGASVRQAFVGGADASVRAWRVYNAGATAPGDKFTVNLDTGLVSIPGSLITSGTITGNGAVMSLASTANIQLSPAGTIVHPSGNGTCHMGWSGLEWLDVYTQAIRTGTNFVLYAQGFVQIAPSNNVVTSFENSQNGVWPGIGDGVIRLGRSGARWTDVWAVNGAIQTCLTEEKQDFRSLDPEEALLAILRTPIQTYRAKPTPDRLKAQERWPDAYDLERDPLYAFRFVGFRAEAVDPLFLLDGDKHVSPQHTASIAVSGIQALYNRLAKLEARLREVEK